ncbi:MAG TPA: hypothetical protein VN362_19880 [Xanthobacteraceae bacterium]|jgi:hypothetical protein|nr:hypothetical protein [Xanthobacteraceae bacterium]
MFEMLAPKPKDLLHGLDQLAAARMEQEAVEIRKAKAVAIEEIVQRRRQRLAHQRRQFGAEHDTKTVVLDIPAHDVLGLRPAAFADGENARAAACAVRRVTQQHAGGAVAEQSGGHEHRRARIVDAQAQAAQVDGEEQHMRALGRLRQPRRPRQAGDAAAAAETEDRQPFHRRLELETVEQLGVEARYREPGDRIGDENVDLGELDAGRRRGLERHIG